VLEDLAGGGDGACDVSAAVDPVDPHDAVTSVETAVWNPGGHPGGLTRDQVEQP
jgi:hypothetical protein